MTNSRPPALSAHARAALQRLSAMLLNPSTSFGDLYTAVNEMYRLLCTAAGLEPDTAENRADLELPGGKAIGPSWAAMCVTDFMRTHKLVYGLYKAVLACRKKFPGTRIHILYAGTGPFAALALPLTTVFEPGDIRFTMLEVNSSSVEYLQKIVQTFGLQAYISDIIECDATTFDAGGLRPVHLIVTETMQRALQKEPQVRLSIHLVPFLEPVGVLIPERVSIHAGLLNPAVAFGLRPADGPNDQAYRFYGQVFDLSIDGLLRIKPRFDEWQEPWIFPETEIEIPGPVAPGFNQPCLFTTLHIYDDVYIRFGESGLTQPLQLDCVNGDFPFRAGFRYISGESPGFEIIPRSRE